MPTFIVILPKHKFILQLPYSQQLPLFFSPGNRWDSSMRHKERKKEKEASSSGAAGRKIANILRHRRHRKRDRASNWRLVCIYSGTSCPPSRLPFYLFPPRPLGPESSEIYQRQKRQCRSRARSDISIWFKPTK